MRTVVPGHSTIHEALYTEGGRYDAADLLSQVGAYLDDVYQSLLEEGQATNYLDAAFRQVGSPNFDSAPSYRPDNQFDRIDYDPENAVFKPVGDQVAGSRYWVPYVEGEEICVFTDFLQCAGDRFEGVRLRYDGRDTPDVDPQVAAEITAIYNAIEDEVGWQWDVSLHQDVIPGRDGGMDVDISNVWTSLDHLREYDHTVYKQVWNKLKQISEDPEQRTYKFAANGERLYRPSELYRMSGNIVEDEDEQERVLITRIKHRDDMYTQDSRT